MFCTSEAAEQHKMTGVGYSLSQFIAHYPENALQLERHFVCCCCSQAKGPSAPVIEELVCRMTKAEKHLIFYQPNGAGDLEAKAISMASPINQRESDLYMYIITAPTPATEDPRKPKLEYSCITPPSCDGVQSKKCDWWRWWGKVQEW